MTGHKPEVLEEVYDWEFDVQPRRIFDAGERWCYGRGVGVAERVVERVSGLDLDTYFKRHLRAAWDDSVRIQRVR